jgi:WS/DGAT/MGAT family acyltransferase
MPAHRLSALDASFLNVETPSAHMHLGWVAVFEPPADRVPPSFSELRRRIECRLASAPRFRQRLAPVPLGLGEPVWIDDYEFDLSRHLIRDTSPELWEVVERAMSTPLERDRPLWEMWIADSLADGSIGLVGKMHHCMVDGLAAVELASLLFDSDDETTEGDWRTDPPPTGPELVAASATAAANDAADTARSWLRTIRSPTQMLELGANAVRAASVVARSVKPASQSAVSGEPVSPDRHLGTLARDVDELRQVRNRFDCTLNDVLLAAVAGGLRRFLGRSGESPPRLRALVPVNVRVAQEENPLGNRISFMLVDLPCEEPDPARRIRLIQEEVTVRKRSGDARATDTLMNALAWAPGVVRRAAARAVASPRMFNLSVSNIPGPMDAELTFAGCRLAEAYPIVPLADGHAVSIGMTTVGQHAFFGLYADRRALDADLLAADLDAAIDELISLTVAEEVAELMTEPTEVTPTAGPTELEKALARRDLLRYEYETLAGTPAELDAYVELHEANVEVSARERWLEWLESELLGPPLDPEEALADFGLCEECARRFGVREGGTDDMTQYGLGAAPSAQLAARINRERARGGEPRLCSHERTPVPTA